MAYDNELSGALFKNENRREGKQDPEYKGTVTVHGVEYWVSAWVNTSKAGQKFMSLKLQPKEARKQAKAAPKPATPDFEDDSEIPF